jgi:small conductance mechanosensitive channel
MTRFTCLILSVFVLVLICGPGQAQETQGQPPESQAQPGSDQENEEGKPAGPDSEAPVEAPGQISDAELLVELERAIESDKARLAELKAESKKQEESFDRMNEYSRKAKKTLEKKKQELQELSAEEPSPKAEALKSEIETLEEDQARVKKRSDLLYQTGKTAKEQIKTLTEKIEGNLQTVDRLSGKIQPEREAAAPPSAPRRAPGAMPTTPVSPIPGIPGMPPAIQEPPVEREAPPDVLETPEQIQARKQAEKKEQEAREAAEVIVEYVERKETLKEQIALEKTSLETAQETLDNLEGLLATRERLMDEKIAAGAKKAELSKIQKETKYIQAEMEKLHDEIDERNDHLRELYDQLERVREEQIGVMGEAERKRAEAQKARKKSTWLESPLHPRNVTQWSTTRGPRMLAILAATFVILLVVRFVLKRIARVMMTHIPGEAEQKEKRATTLGSTLTSAATGVIVIAGILMALEEAGVDIKTVLGGAAVLGLAVAFGAQNLMRDYFNGFMILMEGQFELNDIVSIGDVTGAVERMSMRLTVLRDLEGKAHFIPNGQIRQVTNLTHAWAQAAFNISVPHEENVDHVMNVLMGVAKEFCKDPEFGPFTVGEPQMLGVDDLGDTAFRVKFIIKTKADKRWPVRREMLRRIKNKFDELGIRIPIPQRVVFQDQESSPT